MSRGTAIYSDRGQKWLTRRHRQKDLALELLAKLMQGLFLSSTRVNKGLSAYERERSPWSGGHVWQSQRE